jgi:hypothetical protein
MLGLDPRFVALLHLFEDDRGRGHDKATWFLLSDAVKDIPFVRLQAAISAEGLAADIVIASTVLPYCDAITLDRKFDALLRDPPARDEVARYTAKILVGSRLGSTHRRKRSPLSTSATWNERMAERASKGSSTRSRSQARPADVEPGA